MEFPKYINKKQKNASLKKIAVLKRSLDTPRQLRSLDTPWQLRDKQAAAKFKANLGYK